MPETHTEDAPSRVYRHAFSFKTEHPQAANSVRAHVQCRPSLMLLQFSSATVYTLPDGKISRIVVQFESHVRLLTVEVRLNDKLSTKTLVDEAKD